MDKIIIASRYLNFLFAFLGFICMIKVVYRTEKQLDKVFKLFLATALVILVASFLDLNFYFGIIPGEWAKLIILVSRTLALVFFLLAGCVMLKLIKDESCK